MPLASLSLTVWAKGWVAEEGPRKVSALIPAGHLWTQKCITESRCFKDQEQSLWLHYLHSQFKPVLIQKEIKHVLFLTYGLNPVIKEMKHKTQLYTLESISGRKHVATKLKAAPDLRTYFISMSKYVKSVRQAFTPAQEERMKVNIMTSSDFSSQRLAFFSFCLQY